MSRLSGPMIRSSAQIGDLLFGFAADSLSTGSRTPEHRRLGRTGRARRPAAARSTPSTSQPSRSRSRSSPLDNTGLSYQGNIPSLDGATEWLNSQPLTPADLRG